MQAVKKIKHIEGMFGKASYKSEIEKLEALIRQASITKVEGMIVHHLTTQEDKIVLRACMQGEVKKMMGDLLKVADIHPHLATLLQKALLMKY